ncbi:hypothetical protein QUA35_04295 [Microcoleus sp. N9_B2]|uniref:hypothetical protein n=1 Tax=unclassified Microcoleus TaxID=2642155 RepID=UPI002FD6D523
MKTSPINSKIKQKSGISNARSRKILTFPPLGSWVVHELCDPHEKFAIERINLTSSTGFMVVLVYGRVRPTPFKPAANQRCKPVPATSLFVVVFAQHSG